MRIRTPFAAGFLGLLLFAAYLGFSNIQVPINDKVLHFVTFFILTLCFYWILEASRRRIVNITLGVCTLLLGTGSEVVQGFINPAREFDSLDIVANLAGSGLALVACAWYHRRMLERKRLVKNNYQPVTGDDDLEQDGTTADVEFDQGQELEDLEAGRAANKP